MALTRGCSPDLIAALSGVFEPTLLIYADWPDGAVRIHSGQGDLSWNGETWTGAGYTVGGEKVNLVEFQAPEEATGLATGDAAVRVAATLETVLSERGKVIRNREVAVYFGITTEPAGNELAAEPVLLFTGYFDERNFTFSRDGEDFSHDMNLGLGIGPSARSAASITHNAEDQQAKYPGDTAGRQVINAIKNANNPPVWPEP